MVQSQSVYMSVHEYTMESPWERSEPQTTSDAVLQSYWLGQTDSVG